MKSKIISWVLILAMVLTFVPSVYAEEETPEGVAGIYSIDGSLVQSFDSLNDAIEATYESSNTTLKLHQDVTLSLENKGEMYAALAVPCDLDLNRYTLTINDLTDDTVNLPKVGVLLSVVEGREQVSICNGKIICNFKANESPNPSLPDCGIYCVPNGTVMLKNIEVLVNEDCAIEYGIYLNSNSGDITAENCVIAAGDHAIGVNSYTSNTTFEIKSGSYKNLYDNGQLPSDVIKVPSNAITGLEGIAENTTVFASDSTTAVIVHDGKAYTYDTLKAAVDDAAKRTDGGKQVDIKLVKTPDSTNPILLPDNMPPITVEGLEDSIVTDGITYQTSSGATVAPDNGVITLPPTTIPVTGITLDKTALSMSVGSTATLTATVAPADATDKTVTWSSGNPSVATVDNSGKVTAVAAGTATITATAGNFSATCTVTVTGSSGGGYIPPVVQKPTISQGEGYTAVLDKSGKNLTITAAEDYEIVSVTVNGVDKGAVTSLSGLKTGDKVKITVISKVDKIKASLAAIEQNDFKLRSKQVKMKNGKAAILITVINNTGLEFDGVEVFRSYKKYSGYGKTPIFTTVSDKYYNTAVKKGNRYYYKARGYIEYKGVKYYSEYSLKAWRKLK